MPSVGVAAGVTEAQSQTLIVGALHVGSVNDNGYNQAMHEGIVAMQKNLPNVKVIRRMGTRGLASAFNRGIIESRGDYVGWMDADMSMPPAMIPKMYRKLVDEKYDIVIMNEGIPRFYAEIGLSHPEKAARLKEIAENWHYIGGTWTASVVSVQDTEREYCRGDRANRRKHKQI